MEDRSNEIAINIGSVWTPQGRRAVVLQTNPSGNVTVTGPGLCRDYKHPQTAIKFAKRVYAHPTNQSQWL